MSNIEKIFRALQMAVEWDVGCTLRQPECKELLDEFLRLNRRIEELQNALDALTAAGKQKYVDKILCEDHWEPGDE